MKPLNATVINFCLIQLEILKAKEVRLRKDLLDCNIQREFLTQTLKDLDAPRVTILESLPNLLDKLRREEK
jgi:hypothetical protein